MKKTYKIIALPNTTNQGIYIQKTSNNNKLTTDKNPIFDAMPYHLYILSNEKIKEGDYFLVEGSKIIHASKDVYNDLFSILFDANRNGSWRSKGKIIATTDASLILKEGGICMDECNCQEDCLMMQKTTPQISESFIQAYIKAYNEGEQITEVQLEMYPKNTTKGITTYLIKTKEDNTVIIHKAKDHIYSKENMKQFVKFLIAEGIVIEEESKPQDLDFLHDVWSGVNPDGLLE